MAVARLRPRQVPTSLRRQHSARRRAAPQRRSVVRASSSDAAEGRGGGGIAAGAAGKRSASALALSATAARGAQAGAQQRDLLLDWLAELRQSGALKPTSAIVSGLNGSREHVYDETDWGQHKATDRYLRHISTMPSSRTVRALLAPTSFCFLQTLAVALYATYHPTGWPDPPLVPDEFFNLTGGALALLLVFRTDASYNRWDEARSQWGKFIIRGRTLVRQGLDAFDNDGLKCALVRWTVAFGVLLKLHLRADTAPPALRRALGAWLSAEELQFLAAARHKPNAALQVLSGLVRRAPAVEQHALDEALLAFAEALGRCERISRVPIPLAYTRHTSRFLIAWLLLLPFGCWSSMGWNSLLFAPLVSFLLFGVDQIGVDLENPFSVLPLDVLAHKLKLDATDMVEGHATACMLVDTAAQQGCSSSSGGGGGSASSMRP